MYQLISKKWGLDNDGHEVMLHCYIADSIHEEMPVNIPIGSECSYPDGREAVYFGNGRWVIKENRDAITVTETALSGVTVAKGCVPVSPEKIEIFGNVAFPVIPTPSNPAYPSFTERISVQCGETGCTVEAVLRKIGTVADSIDEKGRITRRIGILVLDGTEAFTKMGTSYYQNTYSLSVPDAMKVNQSSLCSHFKNVNQAYASGVGQPGYYCDHTASQNKFFCSDINNLADFKGWIAGQYDAGTPVILYYILKTPQVDGYAVNFPVGNLKMDNGDTHIAIQDLMGNCEYTISYRRYLKYELENLAERISEIE